MFHKKLLGIFAAAIVTTSLCAQTNAPATSTNAAPAAPAGTNMAVSAKNAVILPEAIVPLETNAPAEPILKKLQDQASKDKQATAKLKAAASRDALLSEDLSKQLEQLEPTGQYVERYVRIPGGQSEEPKLIRCLVPVFRVKFKD